MILSYFVIAPALVLVLAGSGIQAVQISIDPAKSIATMENEIQISCLPDNDLAQDQEVTVVALLRNNEDPSVFVHQCNNVTFRGDLSGQLKAVGHVGKEGTQTYLNVSLQNPKSQDTGIYTCVLHYLNRNGYLETETASENLLVEKLDVTSLESVLNNLRDEMKTLKKENQDLQKQVIALEMSTMSQIDSLTKEAPPQCAFSVTTNRGSYDTVARQTLILPDVIMQVGQAYNVRTGIFTAPQDGLYVFHLVAFVNQRCSVILELRVNSEIQARLYSKDEQSSITSVFYLKTWDKVKITQETGSCTLYRYKYTLYSGYLLAAF